MVLGECAVSCPDQVFASFDGGGIDRGTNRSLIGNIGLRRLCLQRLSALKSLRRNVILTLKVNMLGSRGEMR